MLSISYLSYSRERGTDLQQRILTFTQEIKYCISKISQLWE